MLLLINRMNISCVPQPLSPNLAAKYSVGVTTCSTLSQSLTKTKLFTWVYSATLWDYIGFMWLIALVLVGLSEVSERAQSLHALSNTFPQTLKRHSVRVVRGQTQYWKRWFDTNQITSCVVTRICQRHFLLFFAGVVSSISSFRIVTVWIGIANPIWLFGFFFLLQCS